TLGALQAMDAAPEQSELARTDWLVAISGGAYMAAAWVTARDLFRIGVTVLRFVFGDAFSPPVEPWSRRSPEEDHLRRHASYIAPGIGGKAWALTRFVLGFALNAGLVVVALAVVFLPAGWVIAKGKIAAVPSATVALPDGG